jgi:hypothetical protein
VHDRLGAGLVEATTEVVAADTNNADIEVADSSRIQNRVSPVYTILAELPIFQWYILAYFV